VLGPSWGRETAVTHGQPRCLADNENRSSTAVLAVMGPPDRIWHARCQLSRQPDHALVQPPTVAEMPIYAQNSSKSGWS
jgi:hypothetical protein